MKTCLRVSCIKLCFTLYNLPYEIASKRFTQQFGHLQSRTFADFFSLYAKEVVK